MAPEAAGGILVLGDGPGAARVLLSATGCEIRVGRKVIAGNRDFAEAVRCAAAGPRGERLGEIAQRTGDVQSARAAVIEVIAALEAHGVPLAAWGDWWATRAEHTINLGHGSQP